MNGLLLSEFRKVRTTKLWWIMAIAIFLGAAVYAGTYGFVTWLQADAQGLAPFTTESDLSSVYNGGNTLARILALVVGVMSMGGEYRHKTLSTTYLATPQRGRVLGAKAIVLVGYGLLYGVVAVLAGILVAIPFVTVFDGSFLLDQGGMWRNLAMGVLSMAAWTLIGMGIGILVRNMIVAILIGAGFAYIVEPMLSLLFMIQEWDIPLNLMPTGATNAMLGITNPGMMASEDPWAWWAGLLVLLAWGALPALIGMLVTVRKDVT
ncbi:MAG: ABC transporter permease [Propionibacteriaceae bacterium]